VSSNQTAKNEFEQLAFPKFKENFTANFINLDNVNNVDKVIFFPDFPEYVDEEVLNLAKSCCTYLKNAEKITPDIVGYVDDKKVKYQEIEKNALKIEDIDKKEKEEIIKKYDTFVNKISNNCKLTDNNPQSRLSHHILGVHNMKNNDPKEIKYIVFEGTSGSHKFVIQEKLKQLERDLAVMMSSGQLRLVPEPICVAGLILNNKNLINTVIKIWQESLQNGDYYTLVSYFIIKKRFVVDIESFTDTIFNLEKQVKNIDNKVDALQSDMKQMKSDIQQVQNLIGNLANKLDMVLNKLDKA